jgi:flagellin
LSKTLQQLSSGSRINSGADDAAGLSLANGLQASATALSQSAKNASEGVDMLQVADGALSQITNLLNRAVTLATEASNGTLNAAQNTAADSEYQKILTEINTINSNTQYNSLKVFGQTMSVYTSDGSALGSASYDSQATDVVNADATTLGLQSSYKTAITGTLLHNDGTPSDLVTTFSINDHQTAPASHTLTLTLTETGDHTYSYAISASPTDSGNGIVVKGGTGTLTFDKTTNNLIATTGSPTATLTGIAASTDVSVALNLSALKTGGTASAIAAGAPSVSGTNSDLKTASSAQAALNQISAAIGTVAGSRGTIGANINTLTAVGNVMTTQSTNTLAAMNDVSATDYGQATSDMSKYQILSQTGIAALSQANQAQQLITKLLQ